MCIRTSLKWPGADLVTSAAVLKESEDSDTPNGESSEGSDAVSPISPSGSMSAAGFARSLLLSYPPHPGGLLGLKQLWRDIKQYLYFMQKRPVIAVIGAYIFLVIFGGSVGLFRYGGFIWDSILLMHDRSGLALHISCYAGFFIFSLSLASLVTWILVAKYRHEKLLRSMLPNNVINHLETGSRTYAESYDNVTIFFCDIVRFTELVAKLSPNEVVAMLDGLYCLFDEVALMHGIYKVETIGDSYMAACGCPYRVDDKDGAALMAQFALDIIACTMNYKPACLGGESLQIRVGIHSGPVVAGVIGRHMPRYCLFGDTVNTASRMESSGEPMKIQISAATAKLLDGNEKIDTALHVVSSRGEISVKGKGQVHTFWFD
jgi:class 3 adenylate cyclase